MLRQLSRILLKCCRTAAASLQQVGKPPRTATASFPQVGKPSCTTAASFPGSGNLPALLRQPFPRSGNLPAPLRLFFSSFDPYTTSFIALSINKQPNIVIKLKKKTLWKLKSYI